MRVFVCLLFLGLLTACSQPDPAVAPDQDSCGAASQGALLGQDATALERVLIMRPVRVIRPGMAVTMDFRPDRINFEISEQNRITRVYCG
ncbi:I78 family peptidase inhibitor [Salibaculum griseiflavum]|uniref:Peptidase inhibitor I78 family protein n=1 Tax=Salibaculum griseiflavum TaxID=1914409 RepID=A0A2V1P7X9_9RHOB|nr:I78 family peptidase inhibitor [Salibaculum griseiflavum]PWG18436.1 hypothetical protein DFK10_00460 [Salibaculum griseiflavum]